MIVYGFDSQDIPAIKLKVKQYIKKIGWYAFMNAPSIKKTIYTLLNMYIHICINKHTFIYIYIYILRHAHIHIQTNIIARDIHIYILVI